MKIDKVSPVRIVEAIEPCLPFWCDVLGYKKKTEVPHGKNLGFVILDGNAGELMLQTRASLAEDLPSVAARAPDTVLFAEVASLAAVQRALKEMKGAEVLIAERTTFYGMRETVAVDPQGTIVIFAQPVG
jgi:catechol 2,3-dioxygenase-like lactoylglutathione lyase family enzyme